MQIHRLQFQKRYADSEKAAVDRCLLSGAGEEIVKANLTMIHYLLSPQILPEPALVRFRTDLKTHTAQVLLANSITLTPGTITVEMKDGEYLIHCYDKTMGEGLDSSVFVSMLKKLEG